MLSNYCVIFLFFKNNLIVQFQFFVVLPGDLTPAKEGIAIDNVRVTMAATQPAVEETFHKENVRLFHEMQGKKRTTSLQNEFWLQKFIKIQTKFCQSIFVSGSQKPVVKI